MKACDCEIVMTDNLETIESGESRSLVHTRCGGTYDPAFILREKRSDRTGPFPQDAEHRAEV